MIFDLPLVAAAVHGPLCALRVSPALPDMNPRQLRDILGDFAHCGQQAREHERIVKDALRRIRFLP